MGFKVFRGDAQGRAQVDFATPSNVEVGDKFTLTINRKDISVTAKEATVAEVVGSLAGAIGNYNNAIPEWAEISAGTGFAADGVTITHLVLTGPTDGKPFTVTASTTDAGQGQVTVTVLVEGVAPKNEKQRVRLGGIPTGGTFTLTFAGQTTAAINYNEAATGVGSLQEKLEALSNIAPGDVAVTKATDGDWTVEFAGAYAETNVPIMTGSGSLLTGGGGVSVTTTQAGGGVNELQDVAFTGSGYTVNFTFNGAKAYPVSWFNVQAGSQTAQFQAYLESIPTIGAGNVIVTDLGVANSVRTYRVEFTGALAGINHPLLVENHVLCTVTEFRAGATQNEKQQVTLTGGPTGGTFTLTFEGQTTAGIAYNANNAAVVAALEALSNIGVGDVAVTGGALPGTPITVEFQGALANSDRQQMTGSGAALTGGSANISVTQEAVTGVNEKQQVQIDPTSNGGTFTLTYEWQTTAGIAYNANAAAVDAALEALSNIGAGDVTVTGGPGPATAWVVEFTGALAKTDVVKMTGDGSGLQTAGTQNLVVASSVTPTGPNWFDEPENWEPLGAPVAADVLVFDDPSAGDVLYGLESISAATFAKIIVRASFENKRIGLLDHNGLYFEYRPLELKVQCSEWEIGLGAGSGHALLRANCQAVQTAVQQFNSGATTDAKNKATQIRGTHVGNAAEILGGSFGSATDPEEVSTWAIVKIGGGGDDGTPPDVFLGAGCTLTDVDMDSGTLVANSAVAGTLRQEGGESTINGTGAVAGLLLRGSALCHYNTTGALGGAPEVSGDAILDFSQDLSAKTVTNPIELFGDAGRDAIRDPFKAVASLVIDFNGTSLLSLGKHIRITRGAIA